jgi:hypothetical protein
MDDLIDTILRVTAFTAPALAIAILLFWTIVVGGIFILTGVTLHACGIFTCNTIWCT